MRTIGDDKRRQVKMDDEEKEGEVEEKRKTKEEGEQAEQEEQAEQDRNPNTKEEDKEQNNGPKPDEKQQRQFQSVKTSCCTPSSYLTHLFLSTLSNIPLVPLTAGLMSSSGVVGLM
jgi:hypothetical protein